MKVRVDITNGLQEPEIVIRCKNSDEKIRLLEKKINQLLAMGQEICLYQGNQEVFLAMESILFFETDGDKVYAHTRENSFLAKYKLYELEKFLPDAFLRISKSAIVNINQIFSINVQRIPSSKQIIFYDTVKHIFVSRRYYQTLKQQMSARRDGIQ